MTFCSLERVVMILVEDLTIVSQREIAPRIFEMVLKGEMVADMNVGQFVHLKVPDPSKLLRRPISISEIDYDKKEATIVYRVEREGTAILSKMVSGQTIDTMGPQGNGFDISVIEAGQKALLVGGGIGVPPLVETAKQLKTKGVEVVSVIGFANKDAVILEDKLKACGDVYVTTDDGSYGIKGYVSTVIDGFDWTPEDVCSCMSPKEKDMMRSRTWKRVLAAVCAGVAAVSMAACGGGTNSTAKDGVIINSVMNSTSQASLNYNPFSSTALTGVVGALYEPLFYMNNLKDDPTKLEPLMGKSYTISDDAKTIDVTIRDGEKWSDGEPYTAEDVAYTFNLLNSNKALNTGGFAGSAEVLSDTEVRITLDKPESVNALSYLSGTMIVPKHVWEKIDDPVTYTNKDAVGSGPFTVKGGNFSPTAYTFKKNPYYWDEGKPEIDGVRYVLITGGTQASQNALTAGDVDWMSAIFPNMDDVLSGYPDIQTVDVPSSQMAFMTCSNKELGCSGPITDPAVRKAIYYALDRNQINKLALNGQYSELAGSLYPYGQFTKYASDDVPDSPIPGKGRTDEAVKILEDAGYTKGDDGIYQKDGVKLSIKVAVMSDVSDWINAINVASQQLAKIGIDLHADQMSSNEWTQAMQQGQFEMSIYGLWVAGAEPWMFYNQFYATANTAAVGKSAWPNYARYSNKTVDDALNVINATTDVATKKSEYEKIQTQVFEDMPYIPILRQSGLSEMWSDKVTGWPTNDNVYANPQTWANPDLGIVLKNLKVKK